MRLVFCIVIFAIVSSSFNSLKPSRFVPPGTVKINDSLYADINEITNLSWREYEFWTKKKFGDGSPEHLATLPDTTVWFFDGINSNQPYQSSYKNTWFKNHPVVGISYEQALAFCQWRTDRVKEFLSMTSKYGSPVFFYRLPTREEWEFVCGGASEVFDNDNEVKIVVNSQNKKVYRNTYAANCFVNDTVSFQSYSKEVSCYPPNQFRLFDMIGNVAEMTSVKGISKGGSWDHRLHESLPGNDISYLKPEAWLGFRCVCVVSKH